MGGTDISSRHQDLNPKVEWCSDSEVTREWHLRKPKISWQTWKWKMVISWCLGRVIQDACVHFFHWLTRWHGIIYAYLVWFIEKDSMLAFPGCSHIELLKQHASRSGSCRPGEFVGIVPCWFDILPSLDLMEFGRSLNDDLPTYRILKPNILIFNTLIIYISNLDFLYSQMSTF